MGLVEKVGKWQVAGGKWQVATTVSLLSVYLLTLAPDLTWYSGGSDGPELVAAAATLGIPHPPGYPTYVLLGHLFSRLPIGTVAYRLNLFSAIATAVAGGFVTAIAYLVGRHRPAALASGLVFGLMPMVWSQAVISEVYGLNLLLLAMVLWALVKGVGSGRVGILAGLSLTTHLTSLLILPLVFYLTPPKQWRRLLVGLVVGLTPLLILPLLAHLGSPVMWGQADNPAGWWWLVSGQIYRANLFALPAGQWLARLQDWLPLLFGQLAWFGWLFLKRGANRRITAGSWATIALYAGYSFGYNTGDAHLFFLPGLLLLSVLLAEGLKCSGRVAFILPLALLMLNFPQQQLQQDDRPRLIGEAILQTAPANAILLTNDEPVTFTLWYLQFVEGQRPDLTLVNGNLFAFDWYRQRLGQHNPPLTHLTEDNLALFQAENGRFRPVCTLITPTYRPTCP